jgi:hypothetical protein
MERMCASMGFASSNVIVPRDMKAWRKARWPLLYTLCSGSGDVIVSKEIYQK